MIRPRLRTLLRLVAAGSLTVAFIACPITVTVDLDAPLTAPPLASSLLLGSSSALLAVAGCLLRHQRGILPDDAPPSWA